MHIIINHSSMTPIYEQIMDQIKTLIVHGKLPADTCLPSVRALSGELKIWMKKVSMSLLLDAEAVRWKSCGRLMKR